MQPLALATPQLPYFSTVKPSFPPGLFPILSHSVTPVSPPQSELQPELLLIFGALSVPDIYFCLFL